MSDRPTRPSQKFCKHGFLAPNEAYNQRIHNYGSTVEERCGEFYSPEEIAAMNSEIMIAVCAICMEQITDTNDCKVCSDGHKFHKTCLNNYWNLNTNKLNFCPITNTIPLGWQNCSHVNDVNSGGKGKRKFSNKKAKSRKIKKSRRRKRTRKIKRTRK